MTLKLNQFVTAVAGALFFTTMLVAASAPHVPLA
jgi:hypothetical protein